MSVYVDDARHAYGRMLMSHMIADTREELDFMAGRVGISLRWRQWDHYDICQSKRKLAIAYGAVPVSQRKVAMVRRKLRERRSDR